MFRRVATVCCCCCCCAYLFCVRKLSNLYHTSQELPSWGSIAPARICTIPAFFGVLRSRCFVPGGFVLNRSSVWKFGGAVASHSRLESDRNDVAHASLQCGGLCPLGVLLHRLWEPGGGAGRRRRTCCRFKMGVNLGLLLWSPSSSPQGQSFCGLVSYAGSRRFDAGMVSWCPLPGGGR